jgi:histidinol-phosphatase (PHP family)
MPRVPVIDLTGDHHIHTRLCNHASGEMEEYVLAALDRGLQSMSFLEHLECGIIYNHRTWLEPRHFSDYFAEGRRLQKKYGSHIQIRLGVELGYNPRAVEELHQVLQQFPFEHIGLSYHYFFNGRSHLNMVSRRAANLEALAAAGTARILDAYFSGLLDAVRELPCDKICHLDAVLRHLPGVAFSSDNLLQVERLLTLMAEKNIGLEINTSGFDLRGIPYPDSGILARTHDHQIPLIPGSDAHHPDQVGRHFHRLADLLSPVY